MDGYISAEDLAETMSLPVSQVSAVLDRLVEAGLLTTAQKRYPPSVILAALRPGRQASDDTIEQRLKKTSVSLMSRPGSALADTIQLAATAQGPNIQVFSSVPEARGDILVIVANSYIDPTLFLANSHALKTNTPLLPVIAFDSETAWVGPFCIPYQSACIKCFQLRRSANFSDDIFRPELLKLQPIDNPAPDFGPNPLHYIQAGIVSNLLLESVTLRSHGPCTMPGGLTTITIGDTGLEVQTRRVLRVPRCPDCSPVADTGFPQVWFHDDPVSVESRDSKATQ
ncbi:TOMM precursor leader peptide-binding protein [Actinomyces wuliandei]|uniref:TOMM precursor leader peptide-binding protein n=1 Tax=Actinomyces wuliandei TaxID=2057743 RepID=UPI000FD8DD06